MASQLSLGLTIRLTITEVDIRDPVFRHYHEVESSAEQREAESHSSPLVTKRFHDGGGYWVTLSFPDLPDIFCLDESHGRFKGMTLEEALARFGEESHVRIGWGHEHFITAVWEGTQVLEFKKSYRRLKEVLGEKFPKEPEWDPHSATPKTLEQIAATLTEHSVRQEDPLPF